MINISKDSQDQNWFSLPVHLRFSGMQHLYVQLEKNIGLSWLNAKYRKKDSSGNLAWPEHQYWRLNKKVRFYGLLKWAMFSVFAISLTVIVFVVAAVSGFIQNTSIDRIASIWIITTGLLFGLLSVLVINALVELTNVFIKFKWTTSEFMIGVIRLAHITGGSSENLVVLEGSGIEKIKFSVPEGIVRVCLFELESIMLPVVVTELALGPELPDFDLGQYLQLMLKQPGVVEQKLIVKEFFCFLIDYGVIHEDDQLNAYYHRLKAKIKNECKKKK